MSGGRESACAPQAVEGLGEGAAVDGEVGRVEEEGEGGEDCVGAVGVGQDEGVPD